MHRSILAGVFSLCCIFAIPAQSKATMTLLPLKSGTISLEEARIIDDLVKALILETDRFTLMEGSKALFGEWVNRDSSDLEKFLGQYEFTSDYLCAISIKESPENKTLSLEVLNTSTLDLYLTQVAFKTMGDLVLGTMNLVREALSQSLGEEQREEQALFEAILEDSILGTWRGDRGIEVVRLLRGGTGIAIVSSGAQMRLTYTLKGAELELRQSSPNTERFYHPVPYGVAKVLVERAQPMVWTFRLYEGGTVLRGTKTSTAVVYDQDTVKELIHNSMREAEWIKITR